MMAAVWADKTTQRAVRQPLRGGPTQEQTFALRYGKGISHGVYSERWLGVETCRKQNVVLYAEHVSVKADILFAG